ncbi:Hypothetical protein BN2458_PEG1276 [Helicobacter typhlonius]|uniref:Uncharacterized protein n=1 Tax=Helicobacter typhlonius TaxID=76936 RepID=A0A0S4PVU2_9HELI|nr:Hypothetical protein BN2458_PEG1276 [Helicobacter typhlonius]
MLHSLFLSLVDERDKRQKNAVILNDFALFCKSFSLFFGKVF